MENKEASDIIKDFLGKNVKVVYYEGSRQRLFYGTILKVDNFFVEFKIDNNGVTILHRGKIVKIEIKEENLDSGD